MDIQYLPDDDEACLSMIAMTGQSAVTYTESKSLPIVLRWIEGSKDSSSNLCQLES